MKDKELREEVEKMDMTYTHALTDLSCKIRCLESSEKSNSDIIHGYDFKFDNGLIHQITSLNLKVCELMNNQKMIMEYLGIEKVEEPAKTYFKKKAK